MTAESAWLRMHIDWPYDDALAAMRAARDDVRAGGDMVVFVGAHHEEVVTLGRHAPDEQLGSRAALAQRGVLVRRIERGGGATAHGPGQVVLYPVVDLARLSLDVPRLTDALERAAITALASFDVAAIADTTRRGVYVAGAKIASIGFRVEDNVVTHGLSLNVENDLSLFSFIAPCGMRDAPVTSMQACRRTRVPLRDVAFRLASVFADTVVLQLRSS